MKNIAVFGGSFNPIHNGHIALVEKMREAFSLDEVIIVPTYVTPLKDNTPMVSPQHRLNMVKLAFKEHDYVRVSDLEIRRQGKSYTVDTLKTIKEQHPFDNIHFILGADSFMQLPLWKSPQEIFSYAKILTIARDLTDYSQLKIKAEEYERLFDAECSIIESPVSDISSTKVRKLIYENLSVDNILPKSVVEYIEEHGFYERSN